MSRSQAHKRALARQYRGNMSKFDYCWFMARKMRLNEMYGKFITTRGERML